jgi:hypothetical protein
MSVETAGGMSIPGMPGMGVLSGLLGNQNSGGRRMALQLGSQTAATGAPRADHQIPAGLNMGPSLPLLTPERVKPESGGTRSEPGTMERPKGRMLLYWGCGENVRPGQPVVLDFAKLAEGRNPPNMVSRRVSSPTPPAQSRNRTYGDWPNTQDGKPVPANASLRGDHMVKGNYSPEIRFALGETHDFMDQVALSNSRNKVQWKAIPNATGYFATLVGAGDRDEVVFWSSSEVQEMGSSLMDYVPPAEVTRLVREKVVLPASVTDCAVPSEVMKKAGGTPMFNFIAYGPEANFAQPPRPSDPKIAWEPQWTAKARFKSTAQLMLGEGAQENRAGRAEDQRGAQAAEKQSSGSSDAPAADPVEQGIKALRGIFGR